MKCIYCLENKPEESFTKAEHVIPQSFGLFQDNFTLNQPHNKTVCNDCNQYFGDNLEIALARDTVEGLSRYEHGIRSPKDFKSIGKKSRIQHKKIAQGVLKGVFVYLAYSQEFNQVMQKPLPQVGFLNKESSDYTYFLLDDIPDKAELQKHGFDTDGNVLAFGTTFEPIEQALANKKIFPEFRKEIPLPDKRLDKLLVEFDVILDSIIRRAIAKISFNYMAYWQGTEFVLQDVFNPIRLYIRNGVQRGIPFVIMSGESILKDEPFQEFRRLVHIVTVNWAENGSSIVSQVSLNNYISYTVQLATNFPSPRPNLRNGHRFNLGDHKIYELVARK
jgi:hypothetical protein